MKSWPNFTIPFWGLVGIIFFVVILLLSLCNDVIGRESDVFSVNCNPTVNAEGVLKAGVEVEFLHPVHANVVLVKTGMDTVEVYRSAAESEPQKNLRQICGGWQLEQGICYQLLLVYRPVGEGVQKLLLADNVSWPSKNLVAKK